MIAVAVLAIIGLVVLTIASVTVSDLLRRPTFRRLAFRNALRRKNEALLVILGSLFGTAIVTSAFVVGDTLQASLRDEARTRLGPIDEIVLVHRSPGLAGTLTKVTATPVPGTDGVLTMVTAAATVASVPEPGEQRRAEPNAFVHEVDFDDARDFGGRPGDTGFVDAGPTPANDDAVIGQDLADELGLEVGDRLEVYLYGQVTPFRVRTIVARVGVAGFHPTFSPDAENLFVEPGTLERLAASATGGESAPEGRVLVSNKGGVFDGAAHSDDIALELQIRTVTESGVEVTSEKEGALDFADRQGRSFTQLFGLIGGFIVVAGVLLLVNIFVMLAEERKTELGMLRAVGLKRNHLVRTFGLEGNLYAVAAAAAGSLAGLGVGRVVVTVTERIFAEGDQHNVLQFSVKPASIAIGFAIGLVISLLTVWGTSLRIGFLNVIRAIRDVPEPPKTGERQRSLVLGVLGFAAGVLVFVGAVESGSPTAALVGPAIALWSAVPVLSRVVPRRAAVSLPCIVLIVYEIAAFGLLGSTFRSPGVEVFFAQGVILVFTAVALVITNDDQVSHVSDLLTRSGRGLATRLGLANPLAKRFRTALLVGMYALIVFVLVFMTVFASVFEAQSPQVADDTRAGYDLRVDSNATNPVTTEQLQGDDDVEAVAPIITALAKFETSTDSDTFQRRFSGFDESLLARGVPVLSDRDPAYPTDEAAWRAVLTSSDLTIVPSNFLAVGAGPPSSTVDVGEQITLVDPASGARHPLTIVGIGGAIDPAENGAMVAAATVPTLVDRSFSGRYYVAVHKGLDPNAVGQRLESDFLEHGLSADTFASLVDDRLRGTTAFIRLLQGFLALGLVIGIAGLGVVMVRAVRERRREIGMLRAMGFPARVVRRAFLIEAAFIAAQGVVIGGGLGLVTGFSVLTNSETFGDNPLQFKVPWLPILGLAAAALGASLLAVLGPARHASRIKPAVALRIAD